VPNAELSGSKDIAVHLGGPRQREGGRYGVVAWSAPTTSTPSDAATPSVAATPDP
jgi:hypothetical protein